MATAREREAAHRDAGSAERELERLTSLHRAAWRAPAAPEAPARPRPPEPAAPTRPREPGPSRFLTALLREIPWWRPAERRAAQDVARGQAQDAYQRALADHEQQLRAHARQVEDHRRVLARLDAEQAAEQRLLDRGRQRLAAGDPAASARAIAQALSSLPNPARLVRLSGHEALIAVQAPDAERVVPERLPHWTASGKPTTRRLNQTERNEYHAEVVAAIVVAAGRRALTAAPGVSVATVAAISRSGEILAHARPTRGRGAVDDDAISALYDCDGDLEPRGRTGALAALPVEDRSDLAEIAAA